MMKTKEIAGKLVALCREGKFEDARKELFADDAVSTGPTDPAAPFREAKGLSAIIERGHKFAEMTWKVHSITVSEPIATEHVFACAISLDITMTGHNRMTMSEVCVYEVKDGKIVSEHFHQ